MLTLFIINPFTGVCSQPLSLWVSCSLYLTSTPRTAIRTLKKAGTARGMNPGSSLLKRDCGSVWHHSHRRVEEKHLEHCLAGMIKCMKTMVFVGQMIEDLKTAYILDFINCLPRTVIWKLYLTHAILVITLIWWNSMNCPFLYTGWLLPPGGCLVSLWSQLIQLTLLPSLRWVTLRWCWSLILWKPSDQTLTFKWP